LLVLVGVALTAGTAVFVAAEFSFVALDRHTVQKAVDAGDSRASVVLGALRRLSTQLSAAQVGITLTTLVVGYLAEPSVGRLLTGPVRSAGIPEESAEAVATGVALVVATVFSMVAGELVPQFLGISAPLGTAKVVAVPVRAFSVVATPLIVLLNGSANRVLRAFGVTPREELSGARTPQELASLVRRSAEAGTLRTRTAQHLTRLLDFGERTAADVMNPRVRSTAVSIDASAADVLTNARLTGHSRFPVIGTDWDDVRGVVHVKRAFAVPHHQRADTPVTALMGEPILVPETIRLDPLLLLLRGADLQLAVVVDEYGGTSGVVTLEDVIEEVVGEVSDEHDLAQVAVLRDPDGSWTVPGLWRPDEVRERVGAPVPDGPAYETVGGYTMAVLGRVPAAGDTISVPGWTIRVDRMEGRRVERLSFRPETGGEDG
ncbi:MAG TPA: hemolysin family protein, partial [Kribbellaceae bacterium]|nr:hemolysin family protein [Kribbellaceae bacterium]